MFFAIGFIFEADLQLIKISENSKEKQIKKNSEIYDSNNFLIVVAASATAENNPKDNNNDIKPPFASLKQLNEISQSMMQIAISNTKILNEYDNFKLACAVIAYTREVLLERNNRKRRIIEEKLEEANDIELELENSYSDEKNKEAATTVKKDLNALCCLDDHEEEEKRIFAWSSELKKIYGIAFEEFQTQYDLIKRW